MVETYDTLATVVLAIAMTIVSNIITFVFLYRTDSYKEAFANVEKAAANVEKLKGKAGAAKKARQQNIKRAEQTLQEKAAAMSRAGMPTNIMTTVVFIATTWKVSSYFGSRAVAKLPFVPPGFITRMSHRNVAGDDMTDSSMYFLLMMISMGLRANFKKLIGIKEPKGMPNQGLAGQMAKFEEQMEQMQKKMG